MRYSITKNRKAFLDMIAFSEGTTRVEGSDDGYNVLVGGTLFDNYVDHPRKVVYLNSKLKSTAAGRYQLLSRYYDAYKRLLNLSNFCPANQDQIALQQIKERRALEDIDNGNIKDAIKKCSNIWASFPGNSYGQRQEKIDVLLSMYEKAGGTLN